MHEVSDRQWAARRDGEIVLMVVGPDAEAIVRAVPDAVIIYREEVKPTLANGYELWGPWVDA